MNDDYTLVSVRMLKTKKAEIKALKKNGSLNTKILDLIDLGIESEKPLK